MAEFNEVLKSLKGTHYYTESARMLHYIGNVLGNKSAKISSAGVEEVKEFAIDETKRLMDEIPAAATYKKRDEIFEYEDALMHLYASIIQRGYKLNENGVLAVKSLVELVASYTEYETKVCDILKAEEITKDGADKIIDLTQAIKDEYQRGKLFNLLLDNKDQLKNLTADAKISLADYTEGELKRILALPKISEDIESYLEIAVDVSKYYATEGLLSAITDVLKVPSGAIRYYAAETLIKSSQPVPQETIVALAEDLSYAELTYRLLEKQGKSSAFPKNLTDPVYLAKSDLVHWLIYPTELNKEPDEIEFIGNAKVKKEDYYVFKFKSDSDTLDDESKNVWLIGWSSEDGGTFSNFDKLADYEGKNDKKTLKNIVKKLIK